VTKEGFTPVEGFRDPVEGRFRFTLDPDGSFPPGMVRVSGNAYREKSDDRNDPSALDLEDYFIDRCEVTNRQFKQFVDQGGYRERKYWKHFPNQQTVLPLLYTSTAGLLESPLGQGAWLAAGALFPARTEYMVQSWEETIQAFRDETGIPGPSKLLEDIVLVISGIGPEGVALLLVICDNDQADEVVEPFFRVALEVEIDADRTRE
jgi:hypothetical protein